MSGQFKKQSGGDRSARQRLMAACVAATVDELQFGVESCGGEQGAVDLKPVETGLIMLQGRVGGSGGPFNMGEATVTRAVVSLESGEVGHGYRLGRDKHATRLSAIIDALGQQASGRDMLERHLVEPVETRVAAVASTKADQAAATRVNFFTVARGED